MILAYTDIFDDGRARRIEADITTDHPASSYGQPVVVLPDGQALNADSWILLNYHVVKASKAEATLMERWLKNLYAMMGLQEPPAASLGRLGGQSTSERKITASRENGKKGGRPGMYTVTLTDESGDTTSWPEMTKRAAIALAKETAAFNPTCAVFIEWFRKSDGQRGYLNPSGDHDITGHVW